MLHAKRLFADRERAADEGLGLVESPNASVQRGKVVESRSDAGMLRPHRLLINADRPDEDRLHFALAALRVVQQSQALEAHREIRMVRPAEFLVDRDGAPYQLLGLFEPALDAIQLGQPCKAGRQARVRFAEAFGLVEREFELPRGFVRIAPVVGRGSRVEKAGPRRLVRRVALRRDRHQGGAQQDSHQPCGGGPGSHERNTGSDRRGRVRPSRGSGTRRCEYRSRSCRPCRRRAVRGFGSPSSAWPVSAPCPRCRRAPPARSR